MTPFVPLSQALDQSREIGALREHARVYLAVVVDQDDEITALKAALRALVEAALDLRGAEGWYPVARGSALRRLDRSEEHTSELQSLTYFFFPPLL